MNRQVILRERPVGVPEARHFEIVETEVPALSDGQVLVRNIYLSVDPAMRGWVNLAQNYMDPVPLGGVMRSWAVGRVVSSRDTHYREGDIVVGMFGWQDYAAVEAASIDRTVQEKDLPLSTALGVLGLNGLTAYLALLEVGKPRTGETVVVSAASGAVGSCVGQIAKIKGCRAVGITDGPEKVLLCREEFGYDVAMDYLTRSLERKLSAACPDGVDVYFDTTSGPITDEVMKHLRTKARVVVCGTMAIPNWDSPPFGPRVERHLLVKRARMEGFLYSDHEEQFADARRQLADWIRAEKLRYREDILHGIEEAPAR
jgi:NADPH-dependent curcumin reductase